MELQDRKAPRFLLRHKILFAIGGASLLVALGIMVGITILLSGAFSTAATKQHLALTHWMLDRGLRYSVSANASDIEAPALNDPEMIRLGAACFRIHCVQCHGAPGEAPAPAGLGMMPIPNSLVQSARDWPATWLYYIAKKGVRMTGMPAWEFRLSDDDLWSTVAFLKTLPFLTGAEYRRLDTTATTLTCPSESPATMGATVAGEVLLRQYACHSCHRIEGVVGPKSHVGPALIDWPRHRYIAGTLPNTEENLARWIVAPRSVNPDTLMPNLGVSEAHARQMASYLFAQD